MLLALQAGHTIRAVIRKPEQADKLRLHAKIAPYAGRLEFVVIPDMTKEGSFDGCLTNVTSILHLASPLANEVNISPLEQCMTSF
jgi:uncharacterized protein YbjT (DUF2867 family)